MLAVWLLQHAFHTISSRSSRPVGLTAYMKGTLIMLVMAAIEELLFRQLLLVGLGRIGFPFIWAALISALLFGLIHITNGDRNVLGISNTALVGFVLAFEFTMPNGLFRVIGMHFGWNFIQWNVLGYPLYSMDAAKIFPAPWNTQPLTSRSRWLNGGGFGAEGSAFTTLFWLSWFLWQWSAGNYPL